MPWMTAKAMENFARRGCHLKGIFVLPLKSIAPRWAVEAKDKNVKIPKYIITGFPKIKK